MDKSDKSVAATGDLILNAVRGGYLTKEQVNDPNILEACELMICTGVALALEAPGWSEEFLGQVFQGSEGERAKRKAFVAAFIDGHRWEDE